MSDIMEPIEKILDCSSITTTLISFEHVLQKTKGAILLRLEGFDIEAEKCSDPGEALLDLFFPENTTECPFNTIMWFHLTRVKDQNLFLTHGILPTGKIIDQVWCDIEQLMRETGHSINIPRIRRYIEKESKGHFADLYRLKQQPDMQGPFGLLIRETALYGDYCNHYLKCPETIEDICHEIKEFGGFDIREQFIASTSPFIIKFKAVVCEHWRYHIGSALLYLYHYAKGEENVASDVSYDGRGIDIDHNQILLIEPVAEQS